MAPPAARRAAPALGVALVTVGACMIHNPSFDPEGAGSSGSTGTSSATGVGSSDGGSGPDSATSGVGGTTGEGQGTTVEDTTSALSTTDPGTTEATGGTTTGGPAPGTYTVAPTLATCVFLAAGPAPYAGPATCSQNATSQNGTALQGLMMIDVETKNLDGDGRPAVSFLRFDVPGDLAGLTVAAATLRVQVADGPDDFPNGPQSGVLRLAAPFDAASLDVGAPAEMATLANDMGFVGTNEWIAWSIDPGLVAAGQPLFLALDPTDDDGVFYRGATTTPGAPYLELEMQ